MAPLNTRVVRRSHAWLHYGLGFSYSESEKAKDEATAQKVSKAVSAAQENPEQWKLTSKMRDAGKLPKQGEGPSAEARAKSWFKHNVVATAADGRKLKVTVSGGDPGYGETAKMLSESALCLLFNPGGRGGVLTPAVA